MYDSWWKLFYKSPKKVWYPIRISNLFQFVLQCLKFYIGWLHFILHSAPCHSTRLFCFSFAPEIFTQLHSVPLFVKPSIWLHFAPEPSGLAPEMSHLALFSNQSWVTWHQSCEAQLWVFDCDSKIEGIPGSCGVREGGEIRVAREMWDRL